MNCFHFVFAPLVVVASLAIGCAESSGTPTSPSSASDSLVLTTEQLSGTWNLQWMQPVGHPDQASPPGYTLTFADDRLSTRADCNTCSGRFAVSEQTLTTGPLLACTLAACPTMAFENTYKSLLSGDSTAMLLGDTLMLSSTRGVLRFSR